MKSVPESVTRKLRSIMTVYIYAVRINTEKRFKFRKKKKGGDYNPEC